MDVTVNGRPLNPRFELWNHSPTGFEWGYGSGGQGQLVLAILADDLGNDNRAMQFYQSFKWEVAARLPICGWTLTSDQIQHALQSLQGHRNVEA